MKNKQGRMSQNLAGILLPISLSLGTAVQADQTINNGASVVIGAGDVQDMNCQAVTVRSGGVLDLSSSGTLQEVTALTIEGTLDGGTGSILKLSSWVNNGTVSSIPQTIQFTTDCGPITVSGTSDTDGDGISDDLEGGTEVDGNTGIGIDDLDVDGDGIYNFLDLDSDGDGIDDAVEGTADDNSNGIPNYLDPAAVAITCPVTNTNDSGAGSLREAITCANASTGETIGFNIPTTDPNYDAGTGVWTITVSSILPVITKPVTIDGTTAAGANCGNLDGGTPHNLKIAVTASGTVNTGPSLRAGSEGTLIKGLSLYGFQTADLQVFQSSDHTIQCNYIGVQPDGVTTASTPAFAGLSIIGLSATSQNIQVGGAAPGEGNVVSGHSQDGVFLNGLTDNVIVQGNILGLSADGSTAVPNRAGFNMQFTGTSFGANARIGGLAAGEGNIVSGNNQRGIIFNRTGTGSVVQGNLIGTSLDGNSAMPNGDSGIEIIALSSTASIDNFTIEGNVSSGNGSDGIYLNSDDVSALSNVTVISNIIGRNASDSADLTNDLQGIRIDDARDVLVGGITADKANIIYAGGASSNGISVLGNSQAALLGNKISRSSELGIDLGPLGNGLTPNDAGDVDTGANSFLNYPVFNLLDADGSTDVGYDFNLDVPANADGYRIEFFRDNVSGDAHGEADEYLGSIDITHAGGDLNFTGTLTANTTVANTDNITATATRKSATGFIETSEFSETRVASAAICGNSQIETDEFCDDGNAVAGDGCSASCTIEAGYQCNVDSDSNNICDTAGPGSVILMKDSDGDGIDDNVDTDDDNDGIPDTVEGTLDTDGDGIPDRLESNILDTDGDGNTDHNDSNADGDANGNDGTGGEQDGVETGPWNDNDGDGIPAHLDPNDEIAGVGDADGDGINDDAECPTGYLCPDSDGDGIPDYMEGIADLELTIAANTSTMVAGGEVIFTLTLINKGPNNATGIKVINPLTDGFTHGSHDPEVGTYDQSTGIWSVDNLPAGQEVTLMITVSVDR